MSERRQFLKQLAGAGAAVWAASPNPAHARTQGPLNKKKLGVALVGLGNLSEHQIAPALQRSTQHCELKALVSGHPAKAKRWAHKYGVPSKNIYNYQNFDAIRNNPDIDIVYIVLPNALHAEYTIRAAKAGKHVLCEKPMAVSVAECDAMIAACRAAGRKLAIGYRLHFEPNNREMVRLARTNAFGSVKLIQAAAGFTIGNPKQWRLDKSLSGGGSLFDIGIYALQAARYISGEEPTSVFAQATRTDPNKFKPGVDESVLFSLKFRSGVLANCTSSYATGLNSFRAHAERGEFEVSPALNYTNIKGYSQGSYGKNRKSFQFTPVDHFAAEMDNFAQCILENKPTPVPGEEGRRDQRIMAAIYRSAESGQLVAL